MTHSKKGKVAHDSDMGIYRPGIGAYLIHRSYTDNALKK